MDYIRYPPTVKVLVEEIKRASDDYFARQLPEEQLRSITLEWAKTSGDKLFAGPHQFSSTVEQRLGQKRLKLINIMLSGWHYEKR